MFKNEPLKSGILGHVDLLSSVADKTGSTLFNFKILLILLYRYAGNANCWIISKDLKL